MFRGTSLLVPALLSSACTLRAPPGPWPEEWTGWEESKAVTTTATPAGELAELELPEFDEPWAGVPIGPEVPEVAAVEEPPAPETDLEVEAPTLAQGVEPPAAPPEAEPAQPPDAGATAAQETVAAEMTPDGDGVKPPGDRTPDPAPDPAHTGAAPVAEAAPEMAEPAPPPAPLSDVELLDAQVFTQADAPLGILLDLIVDPRTGEVPGGVLQPPEPEGKPRFLSTRELARRAGGGGLVAPSSGAPAVDIAELFAAEDLVPIKGEVASLDRGLHGPDGSAVLKVRDAENLLHRIRLDAADLVLPQLPDLQPGVVIVAAGAATRDDEGKVWIASTLTLGEQAVQIRDASGALLWKELSAKLLPARELIGKPVVHADAPHTIAGWTLSPDGTRILSLALRSETGIATVDWSAVSLTGEPR